MALLALEAQGVAVAALVTTLGEAARRVSMHGVRETLLEAQAEALGIALVKVRLPAECDNETYRERMAQAARPLAAAGASAFAFGDLFLAEIRAFREAQMRALGLEARFPIWGRPTAQLARDFVASGHRAVVTCVDAEQLDPAFLGRDYDAAFLAELPPGVDPCGERGEFHTFVHAGPRLARPVGIARGACSVRGGRFHFADFGHGTQTDGLV